MENAITPAWTLTADQQLHTGEETQVSLRWMPVFGASGYRVYRSDAADAPFALLAAVTEPEYTDTGLAPHSDYRYRIVPVQEPEPPAAPLPAPESLLVTATGPASAALSWPLLAGAQGYVVYRGTDPAAPLERVGAAALNAYADSGLASGATYYYRVAAYDAAGIGALSPVAAVTTLAVPAPGHVTAQAVSPCDIQLRWAPVPHAAQYAVSRAAAPGGPYVPAGTALGAAYRDTSLEPGTVYYYRVAAVAAGGAGAPSVEVSAETWPVIPPASTGLRARALSCRSIAVSWPAIPGANRYLLFRSVLPEGPFVQIAATSDTFFPDGALMPNTTYSYRVAAVSGGVLGPESAPVSATTLPTCDTALPCCPLRF